jgi:hypothetical protein
VKFSAILLCVAASSLVACTDVETVGGGQNEGITPSKTIKFDPSDLPDSYLPIHGMWHEVGRVPPLHGAWQVVARKPADTICEGCNMTTYKLVDIGHVNKLINEVSDGGGDLLCRIFVVDDEIVVDECGL